ncbi:MAG: LLM class flavin-dependent oxidoreductase [Proteobacteria bacterium]|nr:LLM class flavin-dependent oxidoreductase [Pseudomonadota bacterium]
MNLPADGLTSSGTLSAGIIPRTSSSEIVEMSWFAPICSDDFEYLGVPESRLKSSWAHVSKIALEAERQGFDNMLCPSSYQVGQDTLSFAAALAPQLRKLSLLAAIRCGEVHPAMLARTLATIDHMLEGRLTVNIISSDLPGETLDSKVRYAKSREVCQILRQCWTQDEINFEGEFYKLKLPAAPVKPYQQNGGPLLYFGGLSPDALDLCARECDVFLMWPETEDRLRAHMQEMTRRAEIYGRRVDFGLRVHMIVRETEQEALAAARKLVSKLDDNKGTEIRSRALDSKSFGVAMQAEMRSIADDDGFAEDLLWTGVGRARSGCGCALVGTPDQIVSKLNRYISMGIRSFVLSGYPHFDECGLVGKYILPRFRRGKLAEIQGRIPASFPNTPLGAGVRQ